MNLDGLNLSALVEELNNQIAGGRIERIFQLDKFTLLLGLRVSGQSLKLILSGNPEQNGIYLTNRNFENPLQPPSFCMLLRKHLEDGRIAQIVQQELDRVIMIDIDTLGPQGTIITKRLIFEIMGKLSNIIFLQDNIIIDSLRRVGLNINRFRQILPGRAYESPPGQQKINLLRTTDLTIFWNDFLSLTDKTVEKALIGLAFGIGSVTAKEWLWQAGLPPTLKVQDLDAADLASLKEVINNVIVHFNTHQITPTVCIDGQNRLKTISALPPAQPQSDSTCRQFDSMSEAVEYTHSLRPIHVLPVKDALVKQITSDLHKLERKAEKLSEELTESLASDKLKQQGDVLMANLTTIPEHSSKITLTDFYGPDSDSQITISLDPSKSPADNAQKYYHAYHKQKRAQSLLTEQIATCQNEHAYLETVLVSLEHCDRNSDIEEIRQELITAKYIKPPTKRRQSLPPAKPLSTLCEDGSRIFIGKNNKQNDAVTFKTGRSEDLWFHTKDIPGSHVILQSVGLPELKNIELAAGFAAYFSKSRQSSKVPVDYTKRRYVKKPSGAKPGFVIYEKQTTLYVSPAREASEQLLQNK